ncbi:hypothetical protein B0H11DRAFT_1915899 [Mycena galericulata]|nr:hypothetical protein B0H11DRAFT_1915899 [Mycena galericulata]
MEPVLVIPELLALLGDNPMQSEFACHIGLRGKLFRRACWVKGHDALDPRGADQPLPNNTADDSDTPSVASSAAGRMNGTAGWTPNKSEETVLLEIALAIIGASRVSFIYQRCKQAPYARFFGTDLRWVKLAEGRKDGPLDAFPGLEHLTKFVASSGRWEWCERRFNRYSPMRKFIPASARSPLGQISCTSEE